MARRLLLTILLLSSFSLSCKEEIIYISTGGSLVDPKIAPAVIYSYPSLNSEGPYAEWEAASAAPFVDVRFNKLMDVASVKRALMVASTARKLFIDSTYVSSTDRETFRIAIFASYYGVTMRIGERLTVSLTQPVVDVNGNVLPAGVLGTMVPEPAFRLRRMYPSDGAEVYPTNGTPLSLAFNGRVNGDILSHITLTPTPATPWIFTEDSTMLYVMIKVSAPNQRFQLSIDALAEDAAGHRINRPFAGGFASIPFQIYWSSTSETANVPLYRTYSFSTVYAAATGSLDAAFHVTPPLPGGYDLEEFSGSANFRPAVELQPSTSYVIRIDTTLRTPDGHRLPEEFSFSFRTAPFKVTSSNPQDGSSEVSLYTSIAVYFNAELDQSTIPGAFHITPFISGSPTYSSGSIYFYAYSLAASTRYTVTIGTTLRSKGGASLASPLVFSFTTAGS